MKKTLLALALVGLTVRVLILAGGLERVDRLFVPDDAYYTLSIARSLARGLGPTADGVTLTSGFQPLLAFLLVPVFWFSRNPDVPIYATCIIGCVADAFNAVLLGGLSARIAGRRAAIATTALWSFSSIAIANALNGLETALALALELCLIGSWLAARESGNRRALVRCGIVAGLTLLARVDSVFLLALLGISELARRRARDLLPVLLSALLVVIPWWGYCFLHLGGPVPSSGAALRELVNLHREQYLTVHAALGWAAGSVLGSPFLEAPGLQRLASEDPVVGIGLWCACLLLGLLGTRLFARRVSGWSPYVSFAGFGAALFLFYSLYLPALWFLRRYFAPLHAFCAVVVGCLFAIAMRRGARPNAARFALWALSVGGFLLIVKTSLLLIIAPASTIDVGLHGAKGYRVPAREVLALVPKRAVLGALQSGALSYYADGCPEVVGLDGVVDPLAAGHVRQRTLADYAFQRGISHFADWPYNRAAFAALSRNAARKPETLESLGSASPQGRDRFEVSRVVWPVAAPPTNHSACR